MTLIGTHSELSISTPIGLISRPAAGWLKIVREANGLTLAQVAQQLKVTPPAVRSFEQAEAEDRITLASLRRTADAMGCDLIYALLPRGKAAPMEQKPADAFEPASGKVTDLTWNAQRGEL